MALSIIQKSLLNKVTAIILLTSTMTLGVVGFVEYKTTQVRMQNALSEQAERLSERLALSFVKIVWDYDEKLAESVISAEMEEEALSGILVWEEGGAKALFGGWRASDGKIVLTDIPLSDDDHYKVERVIVRNGNPIGRVRVYLTDRFLHDSLREAMWTIFIRVIFLDVVMVLMLFFFIRSFLIRPLSNLRQAMQGMQKGDLDQKVDVHSRDEIGQIADVFNRMAEQLKRREKELLESEEKFSTLVNQAADALFLHDMKGRFLDVNQSACKGLGYSREELLKMDVTDVDIHYGKKDVAHLLQKKLARGDPLTVESRHIRKDGTIFPVEIRLGLIQIGGKQAVLSLARDISERKIAEAALKDAHDELERKVTERTTELSVAKDQAEAANVAKSDFLARMSHEIRTPLNAVTGLANILLKSDLADEQRDYLNKVQIASNNLLSVINDILDFSKVEAGRLELNNKPMDLDLLLEQLADLFSSRVAQKDIALLFDVAPTVPRLIRGDAGRLTQVLTNLIENAVKFTASGEIVLRVEMDDTPSSQRNSVSFRFLVCDTGIGIAPDILPSLFDPFTQVDSSLTRKHEGTGLGLAICARLVHLMGGDIWAESIQGHGSKFIFTASFETIKGADLQSRRAGGLSGLKALVVDDNDWARKAIENLLRAFGFNVASSSNGRDAIQSIQSAAAQSKPYQVVLLDWKMPGMDGLETVRRIRQWEDKMKNASNLSNQPLNGRTSANTARHVPIILMPSVYEQSLLKEPNDMAGVDRILTKPIKPSLAYDTLMALFGRTDENLKPSDTLAQKKLVQLNGCRILVVEDSSLNLEVAMALLEEVGLEVETAENGQVAVEKVIKMNAGYYDAVLMDIQMPVLDGYEAARRIRQWEVDTQDVTDINESARAETGVPGTQIHGARPDINPPVQRVPIIALTAHALKGEKDKCLAAGMDDYLAKPIDEGEMHRVLLRWIPRQVRKGETT